MMPCSGFFVADRPYSRMEVPGMNSSMVDLSGNASSQAIVYPHREREFYNYASSGEYKYCADYGIPADGYNHTIYFTDQDLEAERVYTVASNIPQVYSISWSRQYTRPTERKAASSGDS
jgi:hypothetical protein